LTERDARAKAATFKDLHSVVYRDNVERVYCWRIGQSTDIELCERVEDQRLANGGGPMELNRCMVLVSTMRELCVWERGSLNTIQKDKGSYAGLTWDDERVYVLARNDFGDRVTTAEVFTRSLWYRESIPLPEVKNAHQALWHDDRLYVTSTDTNSIEVYRWSKGLEHCGSVRWREQTCDWNHVNSVWFDESGRFWVCEHNGGTYAKGQPWEYESRVRCFHLLGGLVEHDVQLGRGIHNVAVLDGELFVCSSLDSQVLRYDLESGVVTRSQKLAGWHPRGLSRHPDGWIVGLSACLPKERRPKEGDAGLALLDDSLRVRDMRVLSEWRQVYDVRMLNYADSAHNRKVLSWRIV